MKKIVLSLALLASTVATATTLDVTIILEGKEFAHECVAVDATTNSCVLEKDGVKMIAQLAPHDDQVTVSLELSEATRSGDSKVLCVAKEEAKWGEPAAINIADEGKEKLSIVIVAQK